MCCRRATLSAPRCIFTCPSPVSARGPLEVVYVVLILFLNVFLLLVIEKLDSIWGAILQNVKPGCIWGCQLALYYGITGGTFGEPWKVRICSSCALGLSPTLLLSRRF